MTNPWQWSDGKNPYRGTPFQVLDMSVMVRGRGPIEAHIRRRLQRIETTPERFPLFGEVLDVSQVQAAAAAARTPVERLYAELCTHRPRPVESVDVSDVASKLEEIPPAEPSAELDLDLARLARLVPAPAPRVFTPLLEW